MQEMEPNFKLHPIYFFVAFLIIGFIVLIVALTTNNSQNNNSEQIKKNTPFHQSFEVLAKPVIYGSGIFNDVMYYCPSAQPKTFQTMLAVTANEGKIVAASNNYMTDESFFNDLEYEKRYGMFGGLMKTYNTILNIQTPDFSVPQTILMTSNSFTGTNSGHDLGTMLSTILFARKNMTLHKFELGVQELAFKFPRILEILELFYSRDQWVEIPFDKSVFFSKVAMVEVHPCFIINEYMKPEMQDLIEEIKLKATFRLGYEGLTIPKNPKILLIKQGHQTATRTHDAFSGAKFMHKMEMNDWIILNPEFNDMSYIICVLSHASKIVVSYGAIMWTHMLFFNPDAKVIHLQIGNEVAYEPVAKMKNFSKILIENTDLDNDKNTDLFRKINA